MADTTNPDYDRRQGDPVDHQQPPADSGSAGSFASRHNEFAPGEGHESAAHDPKTGAPVHGDGTPNEALPAQWDKGEAEGQDPAAQETQDGEAERPDTPAGDGQAREAHPGGEAQR
ncbi:hypothetical protein [Microbacterium sp.]|uniref:hypothetical protein n=1 Tax=Microbacterium sp. TaxID=51671 RepID=UPI0028126620|nr:hypothetical protein [Microbacterium sp.]